MLMKKLIPILAISLILSACVTYRPQNDADHEKAISVAINKPETIKFNGHAIWHPNRSTIPTVFPIPTPIEGNMIITDKILYFLEWDSSSNSYNVVKKLPISDIEDIKITTYGLNRQLVIQSKNNNFDLFSYTSHIKRDGDKNIEVLNYIKPIIKKSPMTPERH